MDYWTDLFYSKNNSYDYNKIPIRVKLCHPLNQSVMSLHRIYLAKQQMKVHAVSFVRLKKEGSLCPTRVKALA